MSALLTCSPNCDKEFSIPRAKTQHQKHCRAYKKSRQEEISRRREKQHAELRSREAQAAMVQEVQHNYAEVVDDTQFEVDAVPEVPTLEVDAALQSHTSSLHPSNTQSNLSPSTLPIHDILTSSSLPSASFVTSETGRTTRIGRTTRLPKRYRDVLPEPPRPYVPIPEPVEPVNQILPQLTLFIRDRLKTAMNTFGIWREYLHRPTHDPDAHLSPEELLYTSTPMNTESSSTPKPSQVNVHANESISLLMDWHNSGGSKKSNGELDRLVDRVLLNPNFKVSELLGFSTRRENQRIDRADKTSPLLDSFATTSVLIDVPSGSKDVPSQTFNIPGLRYRRLVSVIRAAFTDSALASKFHFSPYKLFQQSPTTGTEQRLYSELYDCDAFINEHDKVQRAPLPPDEPDCKREKVVAALMFWSDATHLANFGNAKLWPIYMYFGNLSKYIRSKPQSGACHHVAYIPSLPDSLQDALASFHAKWNTQKKDILTHCRRELMHSVWGILLDAEFLHAYKYGIVIMCFDGVERRVYPRIFTYSADYPEKVLLATIRDKGLCPCPRCLVPKSKLDLMGQVYDMKLRFDNARKFFKDKVMLARKFIYELARPIGSKAVNDLLKPTSSVPTVNAFIDRIGDNFDISNILVVDLMHEFELGIWKALFTHLIRILYAAAPDGRLVNELDKRYREIPTFGKDTIRHFATNASDMKKLAARDFEDLLQCSIPVFEGLLDEPHNGHLMKLLYRTSEWHAFAKLRLHTDATLTHLEKLTKELGQLMRKFRNYTCSEFTTFELPKETEARARRNQASSHGQATMSAKKSCTLNLSTYKWHAMGDYVSTIPLYGGTDSYSTQLGEQAHRAVKRHYALTNKKNATEQISNHYRRNEKAELRAAKHNDDDGDDDTVVDFDVRFQISSHQKNKVDLFSFVRDNNEDPAVKNFIPKLQEHILGRLLHRTFDGDAYGEFTEQDRDSVHILGNKIYFVQTCRVNYTTYDVRRSQDVVNPRYHPDVMVFPAGDGEEATQAFWYARVLRIFHVKFRCNHPEAQTNSVIDLPVLWVRWFGDEQGYTHGFHHAKLPKIGFVPSDDPYAFGFLDPAHVIRGCHLIPAFINKRTKGLLPTDTSLGRTQDSRDDWTNYYVGIFADRDLMMRHYGGGVGHLSAASPELSCDMEDDDIEMLGESGSDHIIDSERVNDDTNHEGDSEDEMANSDSSSGNDNESDDSTDTEAEENEYSDGYASL